MRAVAGVHEFDLDDQHVAALEHAPDQYGAHAEFDACGYRVNVAAFVTEYGRARHDAQLAELRQVGDDRFGDAVGEIFALRVAASVRQRQDGERINGAARARPAR